MGIPGSANPLLLASAAPTGPYQIERSLRFNSADSAYLSRTPASAGNRKTFTIAFWIKRGSVSTRQFIFGNADASALDGVYCGFQASSSSGGNGDRFMFGEYGTSSYAYQVHTAPLYRDPSAWYHFIIAVDTTQATAANRLRVYVNGLEVTSFSETSYPTQNLDTLWNTTQVCAIGRVGQFNNLYLGAYLADFHHVDGQALTPTSFGEFDANNVWQPKAYTGSYGTNGFQLKFADNSAATAAALGKDTSGNGHNWTPTNLSVTAGAGNDSLVDSPTNYGTDTGVGAEVRGNYCTLNPLSNTAGALSNGNLDVAGTAGVSVRTESTIAVSSGKWYFEVTPTALAGTFASLGIGTVGVLNKYPGEDANSYSWYPQYVQRQNSGTSVSYGTAIAAGGVVMVAFDLDNNRVFFGGNGTWFGSSNPATGANPAYTINAGTYTPIFRAYDTGSAFSVNFGQRPFVYTAPSGFKALCTANLPEGSITTSGSFTGNANADGPFIWLNGVPTAMTINGNSVTFGTHADKLSNGFKLRTNSTSYNTSGSNTYSITTTGAKFKNARAQANP